MKTVILAGGPGTRLSEEGLLRPKPMEEVGEYPLLWHLMSLFSAQGFTEFVVALGSRAEMVKDYFLNFRTRSSDLTLDFGSGTREVHRREMPGWTVHLTQTGADTETGGRLKRATSRWIVPGETFIVTYGDTLSDVDLRALVAFHRAHGRLATVTAVRPPARFGALSLDGDRVERFAEKPQAGEGWILGGFYVLEPAALEAIEGDDTSWETEALETLRAKGQVRAFRHEGFWQALDTPRDKKQLNELWAAGRAPWKVWNG